jgi:hypothetical protein
MEDIEDIQDIIDKSVHQELLGINPKIAGFEVRPITLASVALLKQVGSPLIEGKQFSEIENVVMECCIFLKMQSSSLKEATRLAYGEPQDLALAALELAENIDPSQIEEVISSIVKLLTDSTSTKVSVKSKSGSSDVEEVADEDSGNGSALHG